MIFLIIYIWIQLNPSLRIPSLEINSNYRQNYSEK